VLGDISMLWTNQNQLHTLVIFIPRFLAFIGDQSKLRGHINGDLKGNIPKYTMKTATDCIQGG
jgi:hypothetical protein